MTPGGRPWWVVVVHQRHRHFMNSSPMAVRRTVMYCIGAGSDAEQPPRWCSPWRRCLPDLDDLGDLAALANGHMHAFTPLSRWLMWPCHGGLAGLAVPGSARWPRPIAVMARWPWCRSGWRIRPGVNDAGAILTGRFSVTMGRHRSAGRGVYPLAERASPTGTEAMAPVVRTSSPSSIRVLTLCNGAASSSG